MTSVGIESDILPSEYAAFRSGAIVVDHGARARWRFTGPRAAETLTGLVTNDVMALVANEGQYAAVLTAKGKIVADVRILRFDDSLVVDVPRLAAPGFAEVVRKFVNPRVTRYIDESAATVAVGVFGVRAAHIVGVALGLAADALLALPASGHLDAGGRTVMRIPDMRVDGFEVLAPADARDAIWQRLAEAGAVVCSAAAWEIVRVEAGSPEWGLDIDETTIPQEANLDELGAISYTKGCYTGQETVARIHFRGHVNRHLRGLRLVGGGARQALPPLKAALTDGAGKAVGDVRTAVVSPRLGPIALAVVRREVEQGATLTARWEGGEMGATMTTLPFPDTW